MWHVKRNSQILGPFDEAGLICLMETNQVGALDLISEDRKTWVRARETQIWKTRAAAPVAGAGAPRLKSTAEGSDPNRPAPVLPVKKKRPEKKAEPIAINRRLVAAGVGAILFLLAVVAVWPKGGAEREPPKAPADARASVEPPVETDTATNTPPPVSKFGASIQDRVLLVETDDGSGTAFPLRMEDGRTYLVSNSHVFSGKSLPRAKFIDGTEVKLGAYSVAEDRDLARFELIDCAVEPLEMDEASPQNNDPITIYGNSLGNDMITESKGRVLGVGPVLIEVDGDVVHGNSGGPVVGKNGKVLAVLTGGKKQDSSEKDWTLKNTRYDGAVQRFATRFNRVVWKKVDRQGYQRQFEKLWYCDSFLCQLATYSIEDGVETKRVEPALDEDEVESILGGQVGFKRRFMPVMEAYRTFFEKATEGIELESQKEAFVERIKRDTSLSAEARRTLHQRYLARIEECGEAANQAWRDYLRSKKAAYLYAKQVLESESWCVNQLRDGTDGPEGRGVDHALWCIDNVWLPELNKALAKLEE